MLATGEGVTYYDVVVAHPFTTGVPTGSVGELHTQQVSADAAVGPAARGKHVKYAPPPPVAGQPSVPRVQLVPLAFDTYGRWGEEAVRALRAAVRRRLAQPDARRGATMRGVHGRLLKRWRASGAVAVQRRNYDVWRDCLPGGSQVVADDEGVSAAGSAGLLACLLSAGCAGAG